MRSFWAGLSDRERVLIAVAGALAAMLALILLIIRPLNGWRADQASAAARSESVYVLVSEAAAASGAVVAQGPARNASIPIRNAVSQTAAQSGVNLNSYNVRPDGSVEANAAATDPAALFTWLGVLTADYGVSVDYADIAREQVDPALVRAQLTFSRPGGSSTGSGV